MVFRIVVMYVSILAIIFVIPYIAREFMDMYETKKQAGLKNNDTQAKNVERNTEKLYNSSFSKNYKKGDV